MKLDSNNYNLNHKLDNNIFFTMYSKEFNAEKKKLNHIIINVNKSLFKWFRNFKQHKYANFHEEDNFKESNILTWSSKSDIKMSQDCLYCLSNYGMEKTIKIGFEIYFDHYMQSEKNIGKKLLTLSFFLTVLKTKKQILKSKAMVS